MLLMEKKLLVMLQYEKLFLLYNFKKIIASCLKTFKLQNTFFSKLFDK
jgi:hypothetical protein